MARVARRIIEKRRNRLLLLIASNANEDGLARLSNSQMASDLGVSVEQVRNACRSLANAGMLESHPQYLYNGAQVENAYSLTTLGCRHLTAWLKETPALASATLKEVPAGFPAVAPAAGFPAVSASAEETAVSAC